MLDRYGSRQSTVQPQQLVWENVAINSILAINNLTQPNSTKLPQLIRIPILIFDIRTNGLIDTGAAASLVSSDILFKLRGKTAKSLKNEENAPIFRTVSGQELHSLGKYEFPVTINKIPSVMSFGGFWFIAFKIPINLFIHIIYIPGQIN
jgi:hypothetical protein